MRTIADFVVLEVCPRYSHIGMEYGTAQEPNMETVDKYVRVWMLNKSRSPGFVESRKSKLKIESCFGGSRVEILSFHLEGSLAVWNHSIKVLWSEMLGSMSCNASTNEFLAPIIALLGACDILASISIESFSKLMIVEPRYL
eukprot:scaffold20780_cov53-Attheya_sp.AAC.1